MSFTARAALASPCTVFSSKSPLLPIPPPASRWEWIEGSEAGRRCGLVRRLVCRKTVRAGKEVDMRIVRKPWRNGGERRAWSPLASA
jgi:hypothetical protein